MIEEYYICAPITIGEPEVPSITLECSQCGQKVWASARMQNDPHIKNMAVMCMTCALNTMPPPEEIIVHPIAAEEMREALNPVEKKTPIS